MMAEMPKEPQIPPKDAKRLRVRSKRNDLSEPRTIVVVAFDGCQTLDVNGPWEVFAQAANLALEKYSRPFYQLVLASPHGGNVATSSCLQLGGTLPIAAVTGPIDTVLVAGGDRDRIDALASNSEFVNWLRRCVGTVRRIGSICTGAFLLAEAGLLDGRRATTHWASCARLKARWPAIDVQPDAIFVEYPPFHTSAGVSAGLDLALALVEADLGREVALAIARELVVFLRRPGGQSQFSVSLRAQAESGDRMGDLITWIADHPVADLKVPALARRAGMSERNFARAFREDLKQTPAQFVEAIRIERAKALLEETSWPLARLSERCGFGSVDSLTRAMLRQLGVTPVQYRERFSRRGRTVSA